MNFDITVIVYCLIFGVLLLFITADWLDRFLPLVESSQAQIQQVVWLLPAVVFLRSCSQSFFHSGLAFTTSELNMSMLPHTRSHLLWHIALIRGGMHLAGAFAAALLFGWITPFTYSFVFYLAAVFSLFFILTILIQWKLFSLSRWQKLSSVVTAFLFIAGLRYVVSALDLHAGWVGWLLGLVLLGVNIYILPRSLQGVDWGRTVEVNDARVWNIKLISHITGTSIKPPKRYGVLQTFLRSRRAKQRFNEIHQLYHRLWRHHLHHKFSYVWKTLLISAVIVVVLPAQTYWVIYISLPVAVYVYIEMAASLFADQFQEHPLLNIIPIEEKGWLSTFYRWAAGGLVILFIFFAAAVGFLKGFHLAFIIQIIALIFWSMYDLHLRLQERVNVVQQKNIQVQEVLRLCGYLFLGAGVYVSPVVLGVFLPPLIKIYLNKRPFYRSAA
ncbi:hypothetical protein [Halobacillus sp. A5]|uniref:hypothetical protein n=1 Tax=Halobacillus sp. A5 TaxID=2880263 RepID=UPI0020A64F09|nr:hypothetical protein [Halobacillus sp. A5]MCP3027256.1 hypothetical protein [Halobacillus sp. A5]